MPEFSGVGLTAALLAGAVSFVSPCVLPLVPGYVSYVAGHTLVTDVDIEDEAPWDTYGRFIDHWSLCRSV